VVVDSGPTLPDADLTRVHESAGFELDSDSDMPDFDLGLLLADSVAQLKINSHFNIY
jgi:hypothetical protein